MNAKNLLPALCLIFAAVAFGVELDTVKTFFADGTLARVYTVQKGGTVREGTSLSYYPNGTLALEIPYKDGKIEGEFKAFYESGKPRQRAFYSADKLSGDYEEFYESGKLRQKTLYVEDKEEGVSEFYYENGKKERQEVYSFGKLDGPVTTWDSTGAVRSETPYVGGRPHGRARVYGEEGGRSIIEEMDYVQGMRQGYYRKYDRGIMVKQMHFKANRCDSACQK